jgi:hypothetical protein
MAIAESRDKFLSVKQPLELMQIQAEFASRQAQAFTDGTNDLNQRFATRTKSPERPPEIERDEMR